MKKLLSALLALALVLTLAACDNIDTTEEKLSIPAEGETDDFVPPADYATVLLVTINPQIRMYLDIQGRVLAVEAVNKDAKQLLKGLPLENTHYTEAMERILTEANDAGYIKSTTVIHVEIDDNKKNPTIDAAEVTEQLQKIVEETAPEQKVQVKVKLKDRDGGPAQAATEPPTTEATEPAPTQCSHDYRAATCFRPATCKLCGETQGEALGHDWKAATCTEPRICKTCDSSEGSPLGHRWKEASCAAPKTCTVCGATEGAALEHSWKEASCAAPKTCTVCGATEGAALEHGWSDATCTVPKTCTLCGATEGTAPGHSYAEGSCTVCGAPLPALGTWYRVRVDGDLLHVLSISLLEGGTGSVWSKSYQKTSTLEPDSPVHLTYQGEDYTATAGAGDPCYFELSGGVITVHLGDPGDNWSELIVLQSAGAGQKTVTQAVNFYGLQIGDILVNSLG